MRTLRTCAFVALAALCGCSAEDDTARTSAASSAAHARVRVVVEVAPSGDTQVLGDARFLRYRDLDPETADLLAGTRPRASLDLGRCSGDGADTRLDQALASLPERAVLQYLDAGEVVAHAAGGAGAFEPSDRPALSPYVVGVEYAPLDLDRGLASPWTEEEVRVTGFGGAAVGGFEVSAALPALPSGLAAEKSASPAGLEVRWERRDAARGVIVSVRAGGHEIRCRTEDDGRLLVASSVLSALPGDATWLVAVERWRKTSFGAAGVDRGELEVAARAVIAAEAI